MSAALPDEYQDGVSAGSLAMARRCWLDLSAADILQRPQRFTFVFSCPTQRMALGLTDFLRYTPFAGYVRMTDPGARAPGGAWGVAGTTRATIWSLASLEHLFMHLRAAGTRYDSVLATLNLLPISRSVA